MKKHLHNLGIVLSILVALVAIFILGAFLPKIIPVDEWFGGWYTFRVVTSGSMEPAISTGSVIVSFPTSEYTEGDVVTFTSDKFEGIPTTHRIVAVEDESFVTKGDANEDPDYARVSESDILGEVFLTVPLVGYLAHFASTERGWWLLVILPAIILFAWMVFDFARTFKRRFKEKLREDQEKSRNASSDDSRKVEPSEKEEKFSEEEKEDKKDT